MSEATVPRPGDLIRLTDGWLSLDDAGRHWRKIDAEDPDVGTFQVRQDNFYVVLVAGRPRLWSAANPGDVTRGMAILGWMTWGAPW